MLKSLQFDLEKEKRSKHFCLQHCKVHSYEVWRTDPWGLAGSSGVLASIHLLCRQKFPLCFNMYLLPEGAGKEW